MNKNEKIVMVILLATLVVLLWRSIPSAPKVYPGGHRMHHGLVGAAMVVLGLLSKKPHVAAFGGVLALDDIEDLPHWLDFEPCDTPNVYQSI